MNNPLDIEFTGFLSSPIGNIKIVSDGEYITSILYLDDVEPLPIGESNEFVKDCIDQLNEYFEGKRTLFELPLKPSGTEFQYKVWDKVSEIPYGETASYGLISKLLGDPNLSRAVGMANGANPIPIIIPCHRVIGNDGSLTGYSGGMEKKKWLLNHERIHHKKTKGQLDLF